MLSYACWAARRPAHRLRAACRVLRGNRTRGCRTAAELRRLVRRRVRAGARGGGGVMRAAAARSGPLQAGRRVRARQAEPPRRETAAGRMNPAPLGRLAFGVVLRVGMLKPLPPPPGSRHLAPRRRMPRQACLVPPASAPVLLAFGVVLRVVMLKSLPPPPGSRQLAPRRRMPRRRMPRPPASAPMLRAVMQAVAVSAAAARTAVRASRPRPPRPPRWPRPPFPSRQSLPLLLSPAAPVSSVPTLFSWCSCGCDAHDPSLV